MGEEVLDPGGVVLLAGEAGDPFLVEVDLQGPNLGDQHVDPHVPLVPFDQKWVLNVLLNDALLVIDELADIGDELNFLALAEVGGLADPNLVLTGSRELLRELFILVRQDKRDGSEIVY
eukprot:CAMPEP_0170552546 /NCGR_PEP_ID=MMETSP0211-20121228/10419_1 /TAXON_ID=311385 /ORGANISM="Pseudokeronopsis sp., Strain OXSARD2" /LENGTH=118 /DNA_ID=CAMNT_0010860319 /DNA_START=1806 /DNA_END=2162 /DNA_ORIENTATION=-